MLEKNTTNSNIMHKAIAIVRQMSADEKLLKDIQKREETIMNERSALNSAKKTRYSRGFRTRKTTNYL